MTILIIVAVLGWGLFLLTAIFYVVGSKANVRESQSLALYSLALLFSEKFHKANLDGCLVALRESRSKNLDVQTATYVLIQAVTQHAKDHGQGENIDTLTLVMDSVKNVD